MKIWRDHGQIIALVLGCYSLGFGVSFVLSLIGEYFNLGFVALNYDKAPSGVSGSDLIANLLTISALTISGCVAYICLPSDRIEVRISTYVNVSFNENLLSQEIFLNFCTQKTTADLAPSCRIMRGLLFPKSGTGGWHHLTDDDLEQAFGSQDWRRLSKFVDKHIDVHWMAYSSAGLGIGMCFGFLFLCLRYFGIIINLYNWPEFGMVLTLFLLNLSTAILAIRLALGGSNTEKAARQKINTWIMEVKTHIEGWQLSKRDAGIADLSAEATAVAADEPELPMKAPRTNTRRSRPSSNTHK